MTQWVRGFVKHSAYIRALKRPKKLWAQRAIANYEAQRETKAKLRSYQVDNRKVWTPAERAFSKILRELKLSYHRESGLSCKNGKQYFLDFFIRRPRIAFEINGAV